MFVYTNIGSETDKFASNYYLFASNLSLNIVLMKLKTHGGRLRIIFLSFIYLNDCK